MGGSPEIVRRRVAKGYIVVVVDVDIVVVVFVDVGVVESVVVVFEGVVEGRKSVKYF